MDHPNGGGGRRSAQHRPMTFNSAAGGGSPSESAAALSSPSSHSLNSSSSEGPDPQLRSPGHRSQNSAGGGGGGSGSGSGGQEDHSKNVPLLGGETIEAVYPDLTYLCPYSVPGAMKGTMTITNYKLYFKSHFKVMKTLRSVHRNHAADFLS